MTIHGAKTTYLLAVIVASNEERQSGLIQPAVWQQIFPNQPELGPQFEACSERERDSISTARTTRLLSTLGIELVKPDQVFFVRQTHDTHQRLRAVVCAVVISLAPLKKRYVPLVRTRFPVVNTQDTRERIIDELLSF